MSDMTIRELIAQVDAWAHRKGWRDQAHPATFGDRIALMHSELSEALEEFRAHRRPDEIYTHNLDLSHEEHKKPEGIPIELADVVIRIADLCGLYGIDLAEALEQKLAFNEGRPYRHGGKAL